MWTHHDLRMSFCGPVWNRGLNLKTPTGPDQACFGGARAA